MFSTSASPSALWFWSATSFQYCSDGATAAGRGGSGGGDCRVRGSSGGERQCPNGSVSSASQGEKGKSPPARGGDIKEDESAGEREPDLQPQTCAQLGQAEGATPRQGYVETFL